MGVIVHGPPFSTCTRRIIVCFLEKNIEFEVVHVDLIKGEHKTPEFMALQPFGQVPAVQDGDLTLFESRAIIRYYSQKYADQGAPLLGKTLEERAMVEQWLEAEGQNANPHAFNMIFHLLFASKLGVPQDKILIEESLIALAKVFDIYENRLSTSKYLAGNFYSLADLSHLPFIHYIVNATDKGHLIRDRKHVNAWWEEISSRPAWKETLELGNLI